MVSYLKWGKNKQTPKEWWIFFGPWRNWGSLGKRLRQGKVSMKLHFFFFFSLAPPPPQSVWWTKNAWYFIIFTHEGNLSLSTVPQNFWSRKPEMFSPGYPKLKRMWKPTAICSSWLIIPTPGIPGYTFLTEVVMAGQLCPYTKVKATLSLLGASKGVKTYHAPSNTFQTWNIAVWKRMNG